MAGLTIGVKWETRPAKFKLKYKNIKYNLKANVEYECDVLGLFQYADGDGMAPYFICELPDGRCIYVDPEHLQFADKQDSVGGEVL